MGRVVRTLFVLLFLAVFAAVAWVTVRGSQARGHLEDAADGVNRLQLQMTRLETTEAARTVNQIQGSTAEARRLTSDPVWDAVSAFPWGGQNLRAVSEATEAVDALADDGLPALVSAGEGVVAFRAQLEAGAPDPGTLQQVTDDVRLLQLSVERSRTRIDAIDRSYVVRAVSGALDDLSEGLELAGAVGADLGADVQNPTGG